MKQYYGIKHGNRCLFNSGGSSCSKRRKLNELVYGQNVNCSSKYNTRFTGIFAEKNVSKSYSHFFSKNISV